MRLVGPDESVRTVLVGGRAAARGLAVPLYADAALSVPADVRSTTDDVIAGTPPTLYVDAYSKIPVFKYPDGVDIVYTSINGGPSQALYARTDERLDALDAGIGGAETPVGAQTKADTALAAANVGISARLETIPGANTPGAGNYFLMTQSGVTTLTLVGSYQLLYLWPMYVPTATPVDRACIEITTLGTGAVRHGIFANDPSTGQPSLATPLADYGTVDPSTIGIKESPIAVTLPAGWHWYGAVWQTTNTTGPVLRACSNPTGIGPLNVGTLVAAMSTGRVGYYVASVTGALGGGVIGGTTPLSPPRVAYRRA